MKQCILIQANGNNERLGHFFDMPKFELFFGNKRIIEHILAECTDTGWDIYLCVRRGSSLNFETTGLTLIECSQTFNRIDTLDQCFDRLTGYDSVLILDSDVIIKSNVLQNLTDNSIAVGAYRQDGKKYGFVEVDPCFQYLAGNEKETEQSHITIGAYSVKTGEFRQFLADGSGRTGESLLNFYNNHRPQVYFSDSHICLGDIDSYMEALWSYQ